MLGIDSFGKKTRHSDVSRTAKIFTVSALEQMLQAKPRCLTDQEINRISEATFSMIALYGCECDRNERTLSCFPKVSAALWRICRHIIGRLTIRSYNYQVSRTVSAWKLVRKSQKGKNVAQCSSAQHYIERHLAGVNSATISNIFW